MQGYFSRIKFLALTLALVLFCYTDCRILFYLYNIKSFPAVDFGSLMETLFYGLLFDVSAILYINALFILLVALPVNLFRLKLYGSITKMLFLLTNAIGILANCSDFSYFEFIHKRTTYDVFTLMTTQADLTELLPLFVVDFWYVFVITIAFVVLLNFFYNKLYKRFILSSEKEITGIKPMLYRSLVFVLSIGLSIIGMRGGLQLIPIGIVNAGDNVSPDKIPLVLNTPFSLIQSTRLSTLEEKNYFTEAECKALFDPCKSPADTLKFRPLNVVVIILESFSKEYTGLSGKESYTPFLDSIMKEGYNFVNAYSNGKRSIEGIPAILSATPSMQEAYLNTLYSNNKITSIANLLKPKGYNSSFFHGGNNGTMNFDSYCNLAGIERYYGKKEYANDADYDGSWGIWDEPFFMRYEEELSKMKQPFVSSVFSLSSHHPFVIPDKYTSQFKEGTLPIHKTVRYTDYALKKFFGEASKKEWFKNTLFVITADHTGPFMEWSDAGIFQIPLLFYHQGSALRGVDSAIVQQTDIMGGILHYLHYDKPYFSMGNDPFSKEDRYAYNFNNEQYQLFWSKYMLVFNEKTNKETYFEVKNRSLWEIKDSGQLPKAVMAKQKLKAFIQTYNNSLVRNKMTCE